MAAILFAHLKNNTFSYQSFLAEELKTMVTDATYDPLAPTNRWVVLPSCPPKCAPLPMRSDPPFVNFKPNPFVNFKPKLLPFSCVVFAQNTFLTDFCFQESKKGIEHATKKVKKKENSSL